MSGWTPCPKTCPGRQIGRRLVCKQCGAAGSVNIVPNWHDRAALPCHSPSIGKRETLARETDRRSPLSPTRKKPPAESSSIANAVEPIQEAGSTSRRSTSRFCSATAAARPSTAPASNSRSSAAGSRCTSPEPSSPSRRPALSCSPDEQRKPQKFFAAPLKPNPVFLIFLSPPYGGVRAPDGPGLETGTGRVRCRS